MSERPERLSTLYPTSFVRKASAAMAGAFYIITHLLD